jgi:hypothetical protein
MDNNVRNCDTIVLPVIAIRQTTGWLIHSLTGEYYEKESNLSC